MHEHVLRCRGDRDIYFIALLHGYISGTKGCGYGFIVQTLNNMTTTTTTTTRAD